ncbi:uncharacterized protein SPPG_06053 [Spizellomyces punctatus DAOM BR117]|uniref:G-protein coupled receptors family 1 profile domain-containing protein n=1 Tax=Spizellomyces punctatus (strain DAOM BR117) TaxID=645134 RepID=A0A0L0H9W0_SPIPD|nr:uncharacterized protein SPPG_06053 [Spizellomyces punctatus DAOM BR117]KNC98345.1 hypothetical protein SPPG_06053 [Spizellomyces punctatus DAOM BR117]|eukprot:XP_016606385.1 hypothetical protein SPPG_06053 [Spizellomyces punctatus DAOM BR117]
MLDAITQRIAGTYLSGMGVAFVVCATVTWCRKYSRNRNKLLQLAALAIALVFNILMPIVAMDLLKTRYTLQRTTVAAFFATWFSAISQYIYNYFMMIRLLSIIEGRKPLVRMTIYVVTAAITIAYLLGDAVSFYALSQSKMSIVLYTNNKYFNDIGKAAQTAGTLLYTVMLAVTDLLLLSKITGLRQTLTVGKSKRKSQRHGVQMAILLIGIAGKVTEAVLKILSVSTTYMSLDSYFRGTNMAIEIWTLVELGVTIQEVMSSKTDSATSESKPTNNNKSEHGTSGRPGHTLATGVTSAESNL